MKYILELKDDGKVFVDKNLASDLINNGYGLIYENKLILENFETLYLIFKNKAVLFYKDKKIKFEDAVNFFLNFDERAWEKFLVYSELRDKNFIVKKGYGENYDFLLYKKGDKFKEDYAKYIVSILHEGKSLKIEDFNEMLNFARRMRKGIIFAIIDSNGDLSFYEASKVRII